MNFNSEMNTKQFAVNWNNHMCHVRKAFDDLLNDSELTDVTLYVEGTKIGAHKVLLSACSSYFKNLFRELPQKHPVIVLKGVKSEVLTNILKFIYNGEVSVDCGVFESFIQTAEFLQICGLTNNEINEESEEKQNCIDTEQIMEKSTIAKRLRRKKPLKKFTKIKREEIDSDNEQCDEISDTEKIQFSEILLQNVEVTTDKQSYVSPGRTGNANLDSSKKLTCPICHKVFTHPYSLHHHKPVHLGRTKCPICSVVLSRKYNLKMHMKSRHNIN